MKLVYVMIFLLFSQVSWSQNARQGSWGIAVQTTADPLRGMFNSNSSGQGINVGGCYGPESQNQKRNYEVGILGQYAITNKWELGVGFALARRSFYPEMFLFCGTGTSIYFQPLQQITEHHLSVPMHARYNFLNTRFNFHGEARLTPSFALQDIQNGDPSQMTLYSQIGIGVSYEITRNFSLSTTGYLKGRVFDARTNFFQESSNSFSLEMRAAFLF